MDPPKRLTTDNGPPFSSEEFNTFLQNQHIDCMTSSPPYPKSNRLIECQIQTNKQNSIINIPNGRQSIEDFLLNIRAQPIGHHLPSLREILHNRTEEYPGKSSQLVDMEQVSNFPFTRKTTQKQSHDRRHNVKTPTRVKPRSGSSFSQPCRPL